MSRKKISAVYRDERYQIIGDLFDVMLHLKTKKETVSYMTGLFSPSEILMIARRIQIAQLIVEGKKYDDVRAIVKVSDSTISKVTSWLESDPDECKKPIEKLIRRKRNREREEQMQYYAQIFSMSGSLRLLRDFLER